MAVDPEKVADDKPEPDAEASAAESESPTDAPEEGQPSVDAEPAYVVELRQKLSRAEQLARDAWEVARRAQGTEDRKLSTTARLEKEVESLRKSLERALTANMSPEEKAQFERDQRLERLEAERAQSNAPNGQDDPALRNWQVFASKALEKAGLKHDDPALDAAFREEVAGSNDPSDWQVALVAAITKVERMKADKARTDVQKAVDQERVKARNEARRAEGKIDRSSPSGQARVRVADMSDEEFDKHWETQKAAAARREAGVGQ